MAKQGGNSDKVTFPKIATEAKLKKIVMCDTANLVFHDLQFSPEQYATLERWRQYKDKIRITLEQVQANMNDSDTPLIDEAAKHAGKKKKSMQQTIAETENE